SFPTLQPAKSDFMIYFRVTDIDPMYHALQKKGIAIHPNGSLEDKLWRQREFSVLDPNGTLLTFGQAIG
ncbi:MAG TPA: VOC family protein, partial [Cyclobacteriaceae bacterium]|nr:VOC family protein [Cyclobacteriaceae bacterium]